MGRIRILAPLVPKADGRTVRTDKYVDPFYASAEHRAWRDTVIANAGGRCEWIENGVRCDRAKPEHRVFADHIRERRDGGAPLDPANGQCLCGRHHTLKTAQARRARLAQ